MHKLDARQSALPAQSWFNAYRPWAEHRTFFNQIQSALPSNSRIVNIGNSYEGRQIYGIKLWGTGGEGSRPVIYFHGTVHAREWISAAVSLQCCFRCRSRDAANGRLQVVEYLTLQLASGWVTNDSLVRSFLNKYEVVVVPFVNREFGLMKYHCTRELTKEQPMVSFTRKAATGSGVRIASPGPDQRALAQMEIAIGTSNGVFRGVLQPLHALRLTRASQPAIHPRSAP